jgi:hypothetical protein
LSIHTCPWIGNELLSKAFPCQSLCTHGCEYFPPVTSSLSPPKGVRERKFKSDRHPDFIFFTPIRGGKGGEFFLQGWQRGEKKKNGKKRVRERGKQQERTTSLVFQVAWRYIMDVPGRNARRMHPPNNTENERHKKAREDGHAPNNEVEREAIEQREREIEQGREIERDRDGKEEGRQRNRQKDTGKGLKPMQDLVSRVVDER